MRKCGERADLVLPDGGGVTMECHFLASYVDLLVHPCHWRGVHAMGGMAAQIPNKHDAAANAAALAKVRQDKFREGHAGHDRTWGAHPGLLAGPGAAVHARPATPPPNRPPGAPGGRRGARPPAPPDRPGTRA